MVDLTLTIYPVSVTAWVLWCGSFTSYAHVNETQNLTFLLELRTCVCSQLILCGRREEDQPPPWLLNETLKSPFLKGQVHFCVGYLGQEQRQPLRSPWM